MTTLERYRRNRIRRGDRVLLCQARHWPCFRNRKLPVWGRVTRIDGGYYLVRPFHCRWTVEQYSTELVKHPSKSLIRRVSQRPRKEGV